MFLVTKDSGIPVEPIIQSLLNVLKIESENVSRLDLSEEEDIPDSFLCILQFFPNLKSLDLSYVGNLIKDKGIPDSYIDYLLRS